MTRTFARSFCATFGCQKYIITITSILTRIDTSFRIGEIASYEQEKRFVDESWIFRGTIKYDLRKHRRHVDYIVSIFDCRIPETEKMMHFVVGIRASNFLVTDLNLRPRQSNTANSLRTTSPIVFETMQTRHASILRPPFHPWITNDETWQSFRLDNWLRFCDFCQRDSFKHGWPQSLAL